MATAEDFAFPALSGSVVARSTSAAEHAAAIVDRARAEADRVLEEARREGLAGGAAEARAEAERRACSAAAAFVSAVDALDAELAARCVAYERQAADLALAVVERILATALELRPELVTGVVAGALRANGARGRITVEVSPDDVELVRAALAGTSVSDRIEVIAQPQVPAGGCIVTSDGGETDARIDVQLARAAAVVAEALSDGLPSDERP